MAFLQEILLDILPLLKISLYAAINIAKIYVAGNIAGNMARNIAGNNAKGWKYC